MPVIQQKPRPTQRDEANFSRYHPDSCGFYSSPIIEHTPSIIVKNLCPAGTHLPITCAIRHSLRFIRQTVLCMPIVKNFSRAAPMGISILYRNLGKLSASDFPSLKDNKGLLASSQLFSKLKAYFNGIFAVCQVSSIIIFKTFLNLLPS